MILAPKASHSPTPAEIVFEMRRLEEFIGDEANAERYRILGCALMQSEGSTALDALAFLNIVMPLVGHALKALPDDPAAAASKSALSLAAGYITRAAAALEAHSQMPDTRGGREVYLQLANLLGVQAPIGPSPKRDGAAFSPHRKAKHVDPTASVPKPLPYGAH